MRTRMTEKAQRQIEEQFDLKREAVELLGLVVAEWNTDPNSVQCFDLRIVQRAREVVDLLEHYRRSSGF